MAVTRKRNEISALFLDDKNVEQVRREVQKLQQLFDNYFDAHHAYQTVLPDFERSEHVQKQYEEQEALFHFIDRTCEWIHNAKRQVANTIEPEVSLNDSISQTTSKVSSTIYSGSQSRSNRSFVTSEMRANEVPS